MKVQAGSTGPIGQPDDAMAGGGLDPVARRIVGAEDGPPGQNETQTTQAGSTHEDS